MTFQTCASIKALPARLATAFLKLDAEAYGMSLGRSGWNHLGLPGPTSCRASGTRVLRGRSGPGAVVLHRTCVPRMNGCGGRETKNGCLDSLAPSRFLAHAVGGCLGSQRTVLRLGSVCRSDRVLCGNCRFWAFCRFWLTCRYCAYC
jgi:hypothetical protein